MKNSLVKDALVLTLITLVAGVALGAVYGITKEPIENAQIAATQAAYKEVFAEADSFVDLDGFDSAAATKVANQAGYTDDDIVNCVVANDASGNPLGYVVTVTSHAGYGGDITFSMGVSNDGTMKGYSITDISETAGLGMKAKEDKFMSQFKNIPMAELTVTKSGAASETEVDAISGATITSKAVTGGVNAGFAYVTSLVGGGSNE